jgi:hypothetical protein
MSKERLSDDVATANLESIENRKQAIIDVNLSRELLLFSMLAVLAYSVCFIIVIAHKDFWDLVWNSGDNRGYIRIAQGIQEWSSQAIGKVKLFWGTGYGILAVHFLSRADYGTSLLLLSTVSGVLGVVFAYQLYGRAVAACFVFVSAALMQRTLVGGSESLFVALFLGSLLAIRKGSFGWGVLLATLATTVKPIGMFVVAAMLLTTLRRKNWESFVRYVSVAACVVALYAGPLVLLTGSPFGNFSGYSEDWHQKLPISVPFYPLFKAALASQEPLSNRIKIAVWIVAVVFVVVYYGLMRGRLRSHFAKYPEETLASLLIILFQLSYNSTWAWAEFPRFIAPVVPFLLAQVGVQRLRQGWLLVAAPVFGLLGAVQIIGLQKLLQSFRGLVGL